jgi:hypothetical protein
VAASRAKIEPGAPIPDAFGRENPGGSDMEFSANVGASAATGSVSVPGAGVRDRIANPGSSARVDLARVFVR